MSNQLVKYRKILDEVDEELLNILLKRIEVIQQIRAIKEEEGIAVHQPHEQQRKSAIFRNFAEQHNLVPDQVEAIYNSLHIMAIDQQED